LWPRFLLRTVIDEFDRCPQEGQAYLNCKTGECYTTLDEFDDLDAEEEDAEEGDIPSKPQWQREAAAKAREIENSEDWISLPTKFDFHEYCVMEQFCHTQSDEHVQELLLMAIQGR